MPVHSIIKDAATNMTAQVDSPDGEKSGVVVVTRPLKTLTSTIKFFSNDTYGIDMAQDGSLGGADENVHDGLDNVYWTASSIIGIKFDFNDNTVFHDTANSVSSTNAAVNATMQFAKGGNLDVSGYVAIEFWIYVASNWSAGDSISIYGFDIGVGQVGNAVYLEDYFTYGVFGTWHKVTIPLVDMGLATGIIDALRISIVTKEVQSPTFYIDELKFKQTGDSVVFTVKPDIGTWLHVKSIMVTIVDDLTGIVIVPSDAHNATMPGLAYDRMLGANALASGLTYQRIQAGETVAAYTSHQLSDWMQFPNARLEAAVSDGANTMVNINTAFSTPEILRAEDDDVLRMLVQDDLTGITMIRMACGCMVEQR